MFTFEDKKFYKPCFFLGGGQGRRVYWLFLIVKRDWMRLTLYNFSFSCWKTPTNPPLRYAVLEKSVSSLVFVFSIRALDMDLRGNGTSKTFCIFDPVSSTSCFRTSMKHEAIFTEGFTERSEERKKLLFRKTIGNNGWDKCFSQIRSPEPKLVS